MELALIYKGTLLLEIEVEIVLLNNICFVFEVVKLHLHKVLVTEDKGLIEPFAFWIIGFERNIIILIIYIL